jgi:hypothetical protein
MPAHKHTMLQICIICVLCYVLGLRVVWQYPEFFNGAGHNSTDRFITLGSATSAEDSGFFDHGLDAITSYRIDGEELFFPPRPRL